MGTAYLTLATFAAGFFAVLVGSLSRRIDWLRLTGVFPMLAAAGAAVFYTPVIRELIYR
jgi:hypothetical protein